VQDVRQLEEGAGSALQHAASGWHSGAVGQDDVMGVAGEPSQHRAGVHPARLQYDTHQLARPVHLAQYPPPVRARPSQHHDRRRRTEGAPERHRPRRNFEG